MINIQTFEGFFKKNKDEEIANGILDRLNNSNVEVTATHNPGFIWDYSFTIDDFNIKISLSEGSSRIPMTSIPIASDGGVSYKIFVDDVKLNIGYLLAKKIFKKAKWLYDTPSREREDFIKKDAHINFRKRSN